MNRRVPEHMMELPHHQCTECLSLQAVEDVVGKSVSGQVIVKYKEGHDPKCSHFKDNGKIYIVVYED